MIYDQAVALNPENRYPIPKPGESAAYVLVGESLRDLAVRIDARLAAHAGKTGGLRLAPSFSDKLEDTINRYNRMATDGKDLDFRRGESVSEEFFSPRSRSETHKNRAIYPLASKGPYYAIALSPAALDTKGGPRINENAQLIDRGG